MRSYFFTKVYSPYKPYLDAQFADFLERGWDVRIFSAKVTDELSQRGERYGLRKRVTIYPTTLSSVLKDSRTLVLRALREPRAASAGVQCATRVKGDWRERARVCARATVLGVDQPAFCLVHELETAVGLRWLRSLYSMTILALYYHGGEIPTIPRISDAVASETFAAFDVILTNTRWAEQQIIERGGSPDRIIVLPVGFALDDYPLPSRTTYLRDGVLRLVAAGRVSVEKGFADALEAVQRLVAFGFSKLHLTIVGDGPMLGDLRTSIEQHRLGKHVELLGRLDHEDLIEELGRSDALLLTSRPAGNWQENQGTVMQTALLMRTPVIATRTGGVLESIPPFLHQFSAESGNPASIANAVMRFATLRAEQVEELGRRGEKWARTRYDIRKLNDRLLHELGIPNHRHHGVETEFGG